MSSSSSLETVSIKPKFKNSMLSKLAYMSPKWGGMIKTKNNLHECFNNYEVTDTCTIDYFMLGILILYLKVRIGIIFLNRRD
jgi:hypothetical protein